ncbi:(deoxy)nucleoside triphosphate pyrophosphohydrolase [Erysipelotrichaceae bacterium RD49]|nr:(deoxy)nucleoside triphosphate pyrophosphohydrolase [Erysipelotrichaceae bacterium RD49]
MLEVSAAILEQDGKILICQRSASKSCGLLWEFPGGKKEPHETIAQSLVRECQEELGITICKPVFFADVILPDKNLHLNFFKTAIQSGCLTRKEHAAFAWISPDEIGQYTFCPSDQQMLATVSLNALFQPYSSCQDKD